MGTQRVIGLSFSQYVRAMQLQSWRKVLELMTQYLLQRCEGAHIRKSKRVLR